MIVIANSNKKGELMKPIIHLNAKPEEIRRWAAQKPIILKSIKLLALICSLSSCSGKMNISEKMMWSTYPIATQKGSATGFVINHHDAKAPGGKVPVLFTSVHVLNTIGNGPLIIGVRMLDPAGDAQVGLIQITPPKQHGKDCFYVRHPSLDLAAFTLRLPEEFMGIADMPSSLDEKIVAQNRHTLHSGSEVSFLGYPEVLPGTDGAFPVLRSGRVASYPVGTAQAHGKFIINSDVYPGDSGAPVFLSQAGGRPKLVGMIIQRVGQKEQSFSHLAVAVDANAIIDTLALLEASEKRLNTKAFVSSSKAKF
jgi:hypothetical protein